MAERRRAGGLGAAGGGARAAARSARLPAAPGRGADALRLLRARDAVGGTAADAADDVAGGADQRHLAPALPRGPPAGGSRSGGKLPLPARRAGRGESILHVSAVFQENSGNRPFHLRHFSNCSGTRCCTGLTRRATLRFVSPGSMTGWRSTRLGAPSGR